MVVAYPAVTPGPCCSACFGTEQHACVCAFSVDALTVNSAEQEDSFFKVNLTDLDLLL